ncbi:hypothetical protein KEM52_006531 [Ascosphaera acerosa]|nr:hypothetical protein KEM52_006531 [Ascosphaera acerosa]
MPLRCKLPFLAVAIALLFSFFWGLNRYDSSRGVDETSSEEASDLVDEEQGGDEWPQHQLYEADCDTHNFSELGPPVFGVRDWVVPKRFSRIVLQPHWVASNTKFSSLAPVDARILLGGWQAVGGIANRSLPVVSDLPCPEPINIAVARDLVADGTENLLIGAATTIERLDRMLPYWLYSFAHTKAHILVLVPSDTPDIEKHQARYRNQGLINLTLKSNRLDYTARYFSLVEAFNDFIKTHDYDIKWLSWIDDDTFFPSLHHVVQKLNKLNANLRWYIGTHSEATWQVDTFGAFGFGGAGVFISKAVLTVLVFHYQECMLWGDQPGDQKLAQCIFKFTNTELTVWDTLWQLDMTGTVDGFFESGRTMDSLHHWSSWYQKDVLQIYAVSPYSGRRGVLRRWKFGGEYTVEGRKTFWVLTNGYSLVSYTLEPDTPEDAVDFSKLEKTWPEEAFGYEARLGPFRPSEQEGVQKQRYLMTEVQMVGRAIHQMYTRDDENGRSVIEVVWLPPDPF